MSLIKSKNPIEYRWREGDLIGAAAACALLGYKSSKQLQDSDRLAQMVKAFEAVGCKLTTSIRIGGQRRFLRSEIDAYLTRLVETARV